jgi:DNA-binding winged helix-turn-helix (wHTH) protein/Tol biopolymer transport system component
MSESGHRKFEFDGFLLDVSERRLTRDGLTVALSSRAFDLLAVLVENSGRLVGKEDLYKRVWFDAIVEDANLSVQISAIRKALGASEYIDTVKGHGYRFRADVRELNGHGDAILFESRGFSRVTVEHEIEAPLAGRLKYAYSVAGISLLLVATVAAGIYFFRSGSASQPVDQSVRFAKLTSNGKVTNAAVTADGKYAVFSQKERDGESLWLRQIETGSQTRIDQPRPLEYVGLAVAPDGNFIYASVFGENRADTSLVRIPLLGGAAQPIPGIVTGASVSFSPDGGQFAYTEVDLPETHLKVAWADGSNQKTLITARDAERAFTFFQANPVAWSPDGQTLAVAFDQRKENGTKAGILLVNPSDGTERVLVEPRWAFVENLTWADGENVAFIAYDDEWSNQIWTASRSTGVTRQMTNGLQNHKWLSATAAGLVTVQNNAVSSLRVADLPDGAETVISKEIFSESGHIPNVVWGLNGEIFYSSRATGKFEIWTLRDGANPSPLTTGADAAYGFAVSPLDGSFVSGSNSDGRLSIQVADRDGKHLRSLTDGPNDIFPDISPDGGVVFQRGFNNQQYSAWHIAASGVHPVKVGDNALKPVFSAAGRRIAFFISSEGKWRIGVRTVGSDDLKTIDLPTMVNQRRMRWHPSGKFLTMIYSVGEDLNLLLLPVDGGESRIICGLGKGDINSFSWSNDGTQILYSVTNQSRDVVLLKTE